MKNTRPWFEFLSQACPQGSGRIRVQRSESPQGSLFLDLLSETPEWNRQVRFAVSLIDSEGLAQPIRSGEISPAMTRLEDRLRDARFKNPELPLLVFAAPDPIWPRTHAWMLGEYSAERDLPFWVDLRNLPEDRATQWLERIQDTGLACARTLIDLGAHESPAIPSPLHGSGAWIAFGRAGDQGVELIQI